ncbi:MAG TPA: LuxR C-terminal-related transcriptional regulator [Gaiellaceae bacterium]|nr:LuxR C-terminal-related transcriptional regulator [Gaiellaceae bacterium]
MDEGTKPTTESPAHTYIIKRPRLTKRLDDSRARIILLVAPAGYGKTTLARQWLAGYQRPVAWYRATTASADVAALATGLAAEIDAALDDGGTPTTARVSTLAAVQQKPDALARALRMSRGTWPKRLVVAIDDYHHIDDAAAETFVGELVTLLPATFLLTSRSRPSWFTPRLSVYGDTVEVVTADLEMTPAEARQVFAASARAIPGPSTIEAARGWPAVIGLAARSGRTEFPAEALPHDLYEFLAADLVRATSPETQRALTILALSGTNDRALARELVSGDADLALDEAEKRGLLTFDGPTRIVLHPLLGEFLIERLRESGREAVEELVDPLVAALKDHSRWDECLAVAEALPETAAFAPEILELSLQELLSGGRVATVQRWVDVTRHKKLTDPIIELAEAEVALRAGEFGRALALGGHAAGRFTSLDLRSRAELVAGRAANFSEKREEAMEWFKAAEASAQSLLVRAEALWGQVVVHHEEETDQFEEAVKRFAAASDGTAHHQSRLVHARALRAMRNGNIPEAIESTAQGLALLPLGSDPFASLALLTQRAWALGYAARYTEALDAGSEALAEAEAQEIGFAITVSLLTQARALVGLRRFAHARRALDRAALRLRTEHDFWASAELCVNEARLQISLGDLDRARDHLTFDPDQRVYLCMRSEHYAYKALVEAARGLPAQAEKWVGIALQSIQIESRAVAWLVEDMLSLLERDYAEGPLPGVERVIEAGYLDAIVLACRAQPRLTQQIARDDVHRDALTALLLSSSDRQLARAAGLELPRTRTRGHQLSPRELEVYELMIQGRTNREIGKSLFITESTTKVHVRHILEKLGVRSRVEAVRAWRPSEDSGFENSD